MKKAIFRVAVLVAISVGFAVMNATAKNKPKGVQHGATIHVIEHATTDAEFDFIFHLHGGPSH